MSLKTKTFFAALFAGLIALAPLTASVSAEDEATPQEANADAVDAAAKTTPDGTVDLIVDIPGTGGSVNAHQGLGNYINIIYRWAIGIGALLALAIIVFAGVRYVASAGKPAVQADAKGWIFDAIIGLVLLIGAAVLLYTINPRILNIGSSDEPIRELEAMREQRNAEARDAELEAIQNSQASRQANQTESYINGYKHEFNLNDDRRALQAARRMLRDESTILSSENYAAFAAAQEALFNQYPALRAHYFSERISALDTGNYQNPYNFSEGNRISYQADGYISWQEANSEYPTGFNEYAEQQFYQMRREGVVNEVVTQGNNETPQQVARQLIEIEQRSYLADNTAHPWVEQSRAGYLAGRDQMFSQYSNGSDQTETAYNQIKESGGITTWVD
ncbi:MAG: pilin [Candidatus Paceibacterota bacterium]